MLAPRFALAAAALVLAAPALLPGRADAQSSQNAQNWKNDAPGRVHHVDVASLAAPFATKSNVNFPKVVAKPEDAKLELPPGFKAAVFTRDVKGPRVMRIAPNGDIFVSEDKNGTIKVLRPTADGAGVASSETFAEGLNLPFGMQFYPAGDQPKWLYVAENNSVVRFPYKKGDMKASGKPEVVVPNFAPTGKYHFTRDLVFSPDGKRMFVSVGSGSNVGEDMTKKTPEEVKAWASQHALGAAWGDETNRADVLVFDVASGKGKPYATGIRNCVALAIQPGTGNLWCTVNERDGLGDNLVPDYSTHVQEGGYYGWPWYYMGNHEDPRRKGERPDLAGKAIVPDVLYQAHSASVGFTFYKATNGRSAFPDEYVGDAFAVFHGSWNRASRTGHKVVRVPMKKNGEATGNYEDFMVGFIGKDGQPWARPASVTEAPDGSLLVSDDDGNAIYRISYSR
ncbi:MAG TPA: PQQ-dependent sugar dehydrogenase [Gammaproteobacteria bacterium]|nr:PQQ-dependent sugar dehydrogenase [Gammaproteobacteria bacterium]